MARLGIIAVGVVLAGAAGGAMLSQAERGSPLRRELSERAPRILPRDRPVIDRGTSLRPARCEAGEAGCVAVTGRVIALESVDPDGDGDLHVIAAGGSVTGPGVTVFDVPRALRPAQDPRIGQRVTGAGPVFTGSHGQRQIQVTEFRVAPSR